MKDHRNHCEILQTDVCTCVVAEPARIVETDTLVRMRTCTQCRKDVYRNREGLWVHVYPTACEDEH